MFAMENVIRTFPLLDELEKKHPCFTQEEKQVLYRIAFHKTTFEEIHKIILQVSAPQLSGEEKKQLLQHHESKLPKAPNSAVLQIENYIFQIRHMIYEKEKANQMLVDILKQSGIHQDLDTMIAQKGKRPWDPDKKAAALKNGKSI